MSKKSLRGLIAFILVAVIVIGCVIACGIGSSVDGQWFKNGDVQTWFDSWGQGSKDKEARTVAISNDGKQMLEGEAYVMPSGFAFISTRSATKPNEYAPGGEVTISASTSNEFINGEYDWSLSFNNPDSEWAKGKTPNYYINLEPLNNGRQVKVKYLAKFSEQIILTATLKGSQSSDSCTIDCIKDIAAGDSEWSATDFDSYVYIEQALNFGEGTVNGYLDVSSCELSLESAFKSHFESLLNFSVTYKTFNSLSDDDYLDTDNFSSGQVTFNGPQLKYSMFIEGFDDYDQDHKDAIYYAWYKAYGEYGENVRYDITYTYTYSKTPVKTLSSFGYTDLSGRQYGQNVTPSVTLNKNVTF